MGLRLQQAENIESGAMVVQQGDLLGVIEIAMGAVKMNVIIDIRWRRLERQAAVLNGEPEADLIDVIFPAYAPGRVHISQKPESPSAPSFG